MCSAENTISIFRQIKTFAYQAIGLLAERMPQLFRYDYLFQSCFAVSVSISITHNFVMLCGSGREKTDMAIRLFEALKMEAQFLRLVIQDATNSLALAYKVSSFISSSICT